MLTRRFIMDFPTYLTDVHTKTKIGENSAKQYHSRLNNMKKKNIYNDELVINDDIKKKINLEYANKANEYERTLEYYLDYQKHLETLNQK